MKTLKLIIPAVALAFSTPAAAVEYLSFDFTAVTEGQGPTPLHTGSFTLAHDAGVFSLYDLDFAIGSTTFDASNVGVYDWGGVLTIGALPDVTGAIHGIDDFWLNVSWTNPLDAATYTGVNFAYSQAGFDGSGLAEAYDGSFALTAAGMVPEPAVWAMMLFGFGAVGSAMRRRRTQGAMVRQFA